MLPATRPALTPASKPVFVLRVSTPEGWKAEMIGYWFIRQQRIMVGDDTRYSDGIFNLLGRPLR